MEGPQPLDERVAALEAEIGRMRVSLAALEAWGARYGVVTQPGATVTDARTAAGASVAVEATPAAQVPRTKLTGEQILVRSMYAVGLLVLLVGGAFFLSLGLIGPAARTLIGVALGVVLIVVGARPATRTWQADGLLALGAGLEYLSLWYARDVQLIPTGIAALAMFATTGLLCTLAYVHRSERVALAGLLGGFLTPLLVGSDHPNRVTLNAYLLLLSAASLGLGQARRFRYVEFATFFFVASYATQWAVNFDGSWTPAGALVVATLYFALFAGTLLYGTRDGDAGLGRRVLLSLELWAFAAFLESQFQNADVSDAIAYRGAMLALALVALVAARATTVAPSLHLVFAWWAAGAVVLELQAALPARYEAGGWAVEAALLSAMAARETTQAALPRVGSAVLFVVAFALALLQWSSNWNFFSGTERQPLLNPTIAQLAGVTLSLWAAVEFERTARTRFWFPLLRLALHASGAFAVGFEAYAVFAGEERGQLAATVALTAYAAALVTAGVRAHRGLLRGAGAVLFGVVVLKIFAVDLSGVDAFVRFLSFVAVGVVLVVVATWYNRALARERAGAETEPA